MKKERGSKGERGELEGRRARRDMGNNEGEGGKLIEKEKGKHKGTLLAS